MVWHTAGGDILGQTFQANCVPKGAAFPIATSANAEIEPSVAALPFNHYVVSWAEATGGGYTLFAQTFRATRADGAPVNLGTSATHALSPQGEVSSFCSDSSYVVTWVQNAGGHSDIVATIVDAL